MQSLVHRLPEKTFVYGFVVSYGTSFFLIEDHFIFALVLLFTSLLFYFLSRRSNASRGITTEDWIFLAVFYLPALALFTYKYIESTELRNFKRYLAAHDCEYVREDIVRVNSGNCDSRTGMCDEGDDTKEAIYNCSTGNEISFRDFVAGGYGVRFDN